MSEPTKEMFTARAKIVYTAYGPLIRKNRIHIGVSLRNMAKECGISAGYLSRIENGNITSVSKKVRQKILKYFNQQNGV